MRNWIRVSRALVFRNTLILGFEVLTTMVLKMKIFWNVTQYHWASSFPRFSKGHTALNFLGQVLRDVPLVRKALQYIETSETIRSSVRHYVPKDLLLYSNAAL